MKIFLKLSLSSLSTLIFLSQDVRAQIFDIVGDKNCHTNTDGTLTNCTFPEIEMIPPATLLQLSYETLVRSRTSGYCELNAVQAALQIRLGNRGEIENNFLRYEDFSIDHNRIRILTHPRSYPLGSIAVYPKLPQIFSSIIFPEGCQISLEIKLNRLAIKSRRRANHHISLLTMEVENLTRARAALIHLRCYQNQLLDNQNLIQTIRTFFTTGTSKADYELSKGHWKTLLVPLRDSLTAAQHLGYHLESLDNLTHQLTDLFSLLDQAVDEATSLAELRELFDHAEQLATHSRLEKKETTLLFQTEYLNQVDQTLKEAERDIQTVKDYLEAEFPAGKRSHRLDEQLEEILSAEISGPHGVTDRYLYELTQIGQN